MHRYILSYGCLGLTIVILFVHIATLTVSATIIPQNPDFPSVSAQSAIVLETSGGNIVYEKNAHLRLPMASTTKIMTAIVALEYSDPSLLVKIPSSAVGIEGSSIYLYDGEILSMEHLLYALLLESANDAAIAIAIAVSGTVDAFVELMNLKAISLGLTSTHFTNPHGLDHEEHYTTASDLANLAAYCIQNDLFRTIVSTQRMTIPLHDQEGVRLLLNHNRLLRSYEGAIGLKTGFTKRSGRCLVSAAQRDGITMICVTLNAPDDWDDHRNMLDYAFSQYSSLVLQYAGSYTREILLIGATQTKVAVYTSNDVRVILPKEHGEIQFSCQAPQYLWVGERMEKDQIIGYLVWQCDGKIIAKEPLLTQTPIFPLHSSHTWWTRLLSMFTGHQK